MKDEDDSKSIVIDIGTGSIKAGFSGDDAPQCLFPAVVGLPWPVDLKAGVQHKAFYVGDEALSIKPSLDLQYPTQQGIIQDFDHFKKLIEHVHEQLQVKPGAYPVMLLVAPDTRQEHLEKMLKMLFDDFSCPAACLVNQAKTALYSSGRLTGTIVDVGHDVSYVVCLKEGEMVSTSLLRFSVTGRHLTEYLGRLLNTKVASLEADVLTDIKKRFCYVALDFADEQQTAKTGSLTKTYTLPNGKTLSLSAERFQCTEALFEPGSLNLEEVGLAEYVYNSIMKVDVDLRKDAFTNIVLNGGSSLFPGLEGRLMKELTTLAPSTMKIKVIASPERAYSTWIGGSIIASLSSFSSSWVSADEFKKQGAALADRAF